MTSSPDAPGRRRRWAALLAVLALVAVAVAVGTARHRGAAADPAGSGAPGPATSPAGSSAPSRTSPAAPAPAGRLAVGVSFGDELAPLTRARIDAALDRVVALHAGWIRVDLSWTDLQPTSASSYEWAAADRIVASARAHRLSVLGLLSYTPPWARAAGCTSFVCPPKDAAQFAAFAHAVVGRYAPQGVTTYQLWNEPNITEFWRSPDPGAYHALVAATVPAIRSADRSAVVLLGGLAYTATTGGDIEPAQFLRRACAAGCAVDAVAFDPYTYPGLPSHTTHPPDAWTLMTDPAAGELGLRSAIAAVGLGAVRTWVTQFGAPTTYAGGSDPRLVSEARQAQILLDGLRLARAQTSILGAYFVNTWQDTSAGGTLRDHFGLVRADGTPKAAYAALQQALAR